jgi:drug/metabolite transporter (DMT)-like permease
VETHWSADVDVRSFAGMNAAAPGIFREAVRSPALAYAGLCLAVVGWASAFVAGKVVLAEIAPLSTAAWRFAAAALVLFPIAWRNRPRGSVGSAVAPLVVMVVCGGVVCPSLFHMGLARTSATNAALLMALSPALTVLIAPFIGERLTMSRLAGVGLAVFGAATVITNGNAASVLNLSFTSGDLLVLLVAFGMVGLHVSSQRVVARLAPSFASFVIFSCGSAALFVLARDEAPVTQLTAATSSAVGALLIMAILSSVMAGQCFLNGVRTVGVSRAVVFVYLSPVVTAALSTVLLREPIHAAQAVGALAVLAGVYVTTR